MATVKPRISLGIDLGTTSSCVCVFNPTNGSIEVVENELGSQLTPSYVTFTPNGRCLVGAAAKNQAARVPTETVYDAKRLIGLKFSDKVVQEDRKLWPFELIEGAGNAPLVRIHENDYRPEVICAMVLRRMKHLAEKHLGYEADSTDAQVVLTVPADFNEAQRQAVGVAGGLADLRVLRIMSEPTAAAVCSHFGQRLAGQGEIETNVLVFDLGGGTLDVSVLTLDEGIVEVKATRGDPHLGGVDFDSALMARCIEEIRQDHAFDLVNDARALRRLRTGCTQAKRSLSSSTDATICVPALLGQNTNYTRAITRQEFEELCRPLFDRCVCLVEQALQDSKMDKRSMAEVMLVGGSTRIPKVREMLSEFFDGKQFSSNVDPETSVAFGAGVQATILSDQGVSLAFQDLLLLDATQHDLGFRVLLSQNEDENPVLLSSAHSSSQDDRIGRKAFIKKNTFIPVKKRNTFSVPTEQTDILLELYEGDYFHQSFIVDSLPPSPSNEPRDFDITFDIDAESNLCIEVTERATDFSKRFKDVFISGSVRLNQSEISAMAKQSKQQFALDNNERAVADAKSQLAKVMEAVLLTITKPTIRFSESNIDRLSKVVSETEEWQQHVDRDGNASVEVYHEKADILETLINSCHPLVGQTFTVIGLTSESDQSLNGRQGTLTRFQLLQQRALLRIDGESTPVKLANLRPVGDVRPILCDPDNLILSPDPAAAEDSTDRITGKHARAEGAGDLPSPVRQRTVEASVRDSLANVNVIATPAPLSPPFMAWFASLGIKESHVAAMAPLIKDNLGADTPQELGDVADDDEGRAFIETEIAVLLPLGKRKTFIRALLELGAKEKVYVSPEEMMSLKQQLAALQANQQEILSNTRATLGILTRVYNTVLALGRDELTYPNTFLILPAKTTGKKMGLLSKHRLAPLKNWFMMEMYVVFVCGRTLRAVPYAGKPGLFFKVPQGKFADAVEFWHEFGPAIKAAATIISAAAKAGTGVSMTDLIPPHILPSLKTARDAKVFVQEYMNAAGSIMQDDRSSAWSSIDPSQYEELATTTEQRQEELRHVAGQSYRSFGAFLRSVGFDSSRLPMRVEIVDDHPVWVKEGQRSPR